MRCIARDVYIYYQKAIIKMFKKVLSFILSHSKGKNYKWEFFHFFFTKKVLRYTFLLTQQIDCQRY